MFVIVARHGERQDYLEKDAGGNWVATADRPWDPPLSEHGLQQAQRLHEHLRRSYDIAAVYSSPLLRCRQTAAPSGKVRVEPGLAESLNESWYRSWSLPGSNGTWGYLINGKREYDPATLHPAAKEPVQKLMNFKAAIGNMDVALLDLDYVPKTSIDEAYSFEPRHLESREDQRRRMRQVVEAVAQPNAAVLLVSHGGPVTHLYEELTGNPWQQHGASSYCCYSVYEKQSEGSWKAVEVNQTDFLHEKVVYERHVSVDEKMVQP